MSRFKNHLIAAAVFALLALIGTMMNSKRAAAQAGPDVTVVNTSANPVPVTGSTTVSGTVTATITGTPTVQVSGTPNVNVTNPVTSPVPTVAQSGPLTNVGRLASEVVSLFSNPGCASQLEDAITLTCFNFNGKALVITDFDWFEAHITTPGIVEVVFVNYPNNAVGLASAATAGSNGIAGRSEHLTTGLVFRTTGPTVFTNSGGQLNASLFRGYLVPNQ